MTLPVAQQSFAEMYEQSLVRPLFRPWAELTLEALQVSAGEHLLDVACGTGIVGRLASPRVGAQGRVVGVDVGPAMLAVARRVAPDVEWREGDAQALPLRDGERFDAVVCQQGLQFMADRAAAVREMHRALRPQGRLGVSTWRPDEEMPFLLALRRIAERHVGPISDRRHGLGEAASLETLLREAGFREIRVATLSRTVRFGDATTFVRLNAMALVGMSARARELGDEERGRVIATIVRDSAEVARPYTDADGLGYDILSNLATARA